jgi:hypothetical protein
MKINDMIYLRCLRCLRCLRVRRPPFVDGPFGTGGWADVLDFFLLIGAAELVCVVAAGSGRGVELVGGVTVFDFRVPFPFGACTVALSVVDIAAAVAPVAAAAFTTLLVLLPGVLTVRFVILPFESVTAT